MHKENTPGVYWAKKVKQLIDTKDLVLYCIGLAAFFRKQTNS